jgi:hypothetical protein
MSVSIAKMFSNVLNLYIAGNQRTAFRVDLSHEAITSYLAMAAGTPAGWSNAQAESKDFKENIASLDAKKRIDKIGTVMQAFLKAVFSPPKLIKNYGKDLAADILAMQSSGFSKMFVQMPALGLPYTYIDMDPISVEHDTRELTSEYTTYRTVSTCHPSAINVARALLLSDRGRLSLNNIPDPSGGKGPHGPLETFGRIKVVEDQYDALQALMMLYIIQWPLALVHANRKVNDLRYTIAWELFPRSRPALEIWKTNRDGLLNHSLHPLMSAVVSALPTGRIDAYHGEKDANLLIGGLQHELAPDELARYKSMMDWNGNDSHYPLLALGLVHEAVKDFISRGEILEIWGDCSERPTAPIGVGKLSRQILSVKKHIESWPKHATALGWGTISAPIGTMIQCAADFILTDGEDYSDEPMAGLLGLRPVLSLGNIKHLGFIRRYETTFNASFVEGTLPIPITAPLPIIEWSVMVVDGFQSDTGQPEVISRFYRPAGEWMGETPYVVITSAAVRADPELAKYAEYFDGPDPEKPARYVDFWYGDGLPDVQNFKQTSWDGYAVGRGYEAVAAAYEKGYAGQLVDGKTTRLLQRTRFLHRFPVQNARDQFIYFYNEVGEFRYKLGWDGNLVYNSRTITLSKSTGVLETIVAAAPITLTQKGAAALVTPTDQVEVKDAPEGTVL